MSLPFGGSFGSSVFVLLQVRLLFHGARTCKPLRIRDSSGYGAVCDRPVSSTGLVVYRVLVAELARGSVPDVSTPALGGPSEAPQICEISVKSPHARVGLGLFRYGLRRISHIPPPQSKNTRRDGPSALLPGSIAAEKQKPPFRS